MASPLQLTAGASIINGQGLATNVAVLSQLTTFKSNLNSVTTIISSMFSSALASNASSILMPLLSNIGHGNVTQGQWLVDLYPANITPISSSSVTYYGNATYPNTASVSSTILTQINLPFSYGMQGFANVYQTVSTYASSIFDTVASVNALQGKTYASSGIGFTGPTDVATNGIGNTGPILANVVSKWGTMYDIKNINTLGNPYVFGQNLLNQKLGKYGNLSNQLTVAGLNTTNLLQVPLNSTTTTHTVSTVTQETSIGTVTLPKITTVVTPKVVTGTSSQVVTSIYRTITEANLRAIVTATNVTVSNTSIVSLNDYLNLNKIVDATTWNQLNALGITTILNIGTFLQSKIGQGRFSDWNDLANTLRSITSPSLPNTSANANTSLLSSSVTTTLNNMTGTGTGASGNPVIRDYLGAVSGEPYNVYLPIITSQYASLRPANLVPSLTTLNSAVTTFISAYNAYLLDPGNVALPSTNNIQSNVIIVNGSINSVTAPTVQNAYYMMLNHLTSEVNNLNKAKVIFDAGYTQPMQTLSQRIGDMASDKTKFYTYQFFSNLITSDSYGDTIKSAVAETINSKLLQSKGIKSTSDPMR
jgi:hypothetical protein